MGAPAWRPHSWRAQIWRPQRMRLAAVLAAEERGLAGEGRGLAAVLAAVLATVLAGEGRGLAEVLAAVPAGEGRGLAAVLVGEGRGLAAVLVAVLAVEERRLAAVLAEGRGLPALHAVWEMVCKTRAVRRTLWRKCALRTSPAQRSMNNCGMTSSSTSGPTARPV